MNIDLVSDLHIDHWDSRFKSLYTIGDVKNYPLNIEKEEEKSKILVIAGDICDNLEESINFLDYISKFYDYVLYVDGNHEHTSQYPELYSNSYIHEEIISKNNKKIIYLPKENFTIGSTCFVGCNGWWNYSTNKFDHLDYFGDINNTKNISITEDKVKQFHANVKNKSEKQAKKLFKNIAVLNEKKDIKNIVVVTHSVPINIFLDPKYVDVKVNTNFKKVRGCPKISHWFFGHSHQEIYKKVDHTKYISNPRGRPSDHNRILYCSKNILIN